MLCFGVSMEKEGHDLYFVLPANTFCGKIPFMALGTNIRAFRASIRRPWPIVDAGSGVGPNYIGACRCRIPIILVLVGAIGALRC